MYYYCLFQGIDPDLRPITDTSEYPVVVHGTYMKCWDQIRQHGLSRMRRTHIHFAKGEPGADGVISGMRKNAEVKVYIDLRKAMDGMHMLRYTC